MKVKFVRLLTAVATLALFLTASQNLRAQAPPPPPAPPVVTTAPNPTDLLSQAFVALSTADRDYDGHRLEAIKSVHAAAKELGVTLKENGHAREGQRTSDDQLRSARGLLQQASTAGLPPKVEVHIQKAIEHIDAALKVK